MIQMPLTPRYSVGLERREDALVSDRTESITVVRIQCPYVGLSTSDIECQGRLFKFRNGVYQLTLQFPFEIDTENEELYKASKDKLARGKHPILNAFLPRKKHGTMQDGIMEVLSDSLLATKLRNRGVEGMLSPSLTTTTKNKQTPLIEEIKLSSSHDGSDEADNDRYSSSDSDSDDDDDDDNNAHYGFKKRYHGLLGSDFLEKNPEVFETIESLDNMDAECRRVKRVTAEDEQFDHLRYMGDKYGVLEDDIYTEAVTSKPFWCDEWKVWERKQVHANNHVLLFNQEREGSTAACDVEDQMTMLVLVDVLFGYCFELRCTAGELTVESAINIGRLSSSLSWLEQYDQPGDDIVSVLYNCCRRGVCYPYLRNWTLLRLVLDDVGKVLAIGKSCILKCLEGMKSIFASADYHDILNQIFIDDFLEWVPSIDNAALEGMAVSYHKELGRLDDIDPESGVPLKDFVGYPLSQLEAIVESSVTGLRTEQSPSDHPIAKGPPQKPMCVTPYALSDLMKKVNRE